MNQRMVILSELERLLLPAMDGTRDHHQLLQLAVQCVEEGKLKLSQQGRPVTDKASQRRILTDIFPDHLRQLSRAALLVG